jgi:hypothetical protein
MPRTMCSTRTRREMTKVSTLMQRRVRRCYIIRYAYSYAHTFTWSTLVLTSSIYHWVRPYRPISRKQRLHLIFDTDPQLGMIPKKVLFQALLTKESYIFMQSEFLSFVQMCQISHYETLSTFLDKRASLELHNSNRNYFYQLFLNPD